jgi:hypothetical protein
MSNSVFTRITVLNVHRYCSSSFTKYTLQHFKRALSVDVTKRQSVVFNSTFGGVARNDVPRRFAVSGVKFYSSSASDDGNDDKGPIL